MPATADAEKVTVTVTFKAKGPRDQHRFHQHDRRDGDTQRPYANAGETVTLTATPDAGYTIPDSVTSLKITFADGTTATATRTSGTIPSPTRFRRGQWPRPEP
jgi:hypothetical protein